MSYASIMKFSQGNKINFNQKVDYFRAIGNNHPINYNDSLWKYCSYNKPSEISGWVTGINIATSIFNLVIVGAGLLGVLLGAKSNNAPATTTENKQPPANTNTTPDLNKTLNANMSNAAENFEKAKSTEEKQDAINLLKQEINKAEDQFDTYENEIADFDKTIKETTAQIDTLTKNIDDNTKKIDDLERNISTSEDQISKLKNGTPTEQAIAKELENQITNMKAERKALMAEIDTLNEKREEQKAKKKEAETNLTTKKAAQDALKKEIDAANAKIAKYEKELASRTVETYYFKDKPENIQNKLTGLGPDEYNVSDDMYKNIMLTINPKI